MRKDFLIAGEFTGLDLCSAQLISFAAIFLGRVKPITQRRVANKL